MTRVYPKLLRTLFSDKKCLVARFIRHRLPICKLSQQSGLLSAGFEQALCIDCVRNLATNRRFDGAERGI